MQKADYENENIYSRLEKSIARLKEIFGDSSDLNVMRFETAGVKTALISLEGMIASRELSRIIYEPLREFSKRNRLPDEVFSYIADECGFSNEKKVINTFGEGVQLLCGGFALVLVHGISRGVAVAAQGYSIRAVSPPDSESDVMGTREALSDNIRTSISLIRRRVKSPRLRFEFVRAGKLSDIELCLVYIDGKTPKKLKNEVKSRLEKIKLELILTSGNIIPFISENGGSFFTGASTTERPDVLAAKVNEGRIAVLIDGIPYAVVYPSLFIENFQTVDDYSQKPYYVAYMRVIRYLAFIISTLLPGAYVAAATHHPEVLSRLLLINLIASEELTPYPLIVEMLIVIVMFEILREAGLRLPKVIGGAVSIVGGLVIGDAAVTSGLIPAPLLIIIGITATCSFALPSLGQQMAVIRLINVILGGLTGLFGIAVFAAMVFVNACVTDAFGIPYTAPITPFTKSAMRDVLVRVGFLKMQQNHPTVEELNGSGGENEN